MSKIYLLFIGIISSFLLTSCSKTCYCELSTRSETYHYDYHLKGYTQYGVSDCNDLANHFEETAMDKYGEQISATCRDSGTSL